MIGLAAYSGTFSEYRKSGWSYSIGWVAFTLSVAAGLYFIVVGIYRLCRHRGGPDIEEVDYKPLAQMDGSTNTSSDDDD